MIGYNKTCRVSDYAALESDWQEVYGVSGVGREFRKEWEIVQSIRGLQEGGAIWPGARVLGVGAAQEWTSFYLTRHVEQVFCTDLYLSDGGWHEWAPKEMLIDPTPYAGGKAFNRERLVVQDMNARRLWYPDNFFDGIFSASSIEHVGDLDDVAQAMREMGRVLKPGGTIAITTEFKIKPCESHRFGDVVVFEPDTLQRYVIAPSGCTLIDAPDYVTDPETLATAQDLQWAIETINREKTIPTPHIVLTSGPFTFTSVSVTMRKPI